MTGSYHGCSALATQHTDDIARDKAVGGLYRLIEMAVGEIAISPDVKTWQWDVLDNLVKLNKGKRILFYAAIWPDWMAGLNQADHTRALSNYVHQIAHRYSRSPLLGGVGGGSLWCIQVNNEPGFNMQGPTPAWKAIPGVTDDDASLNAALVAEYKACKAAVKGTKVLIGGPAFSNENWYESADAILNKLGGAKYLDVVILHDYANKHPFDRTARSLPTDERYAKWRALAGNKPLVLGEFGIRGQSASSAKYPNTGAAEGHNSGFTEQEGIRDAIQSAILMRAAGVIILPHVITQSCLLPRDAARNLEIYGYEVNDGTMFFSEIPMKSKTRAFLDTMHLLDGLTKAQITALARKVKQLEIKQ